MKTNNRYFAREFAPGKWHVCDREGFNLPIYDDAPYGQDKPLVFDEDRAAEYVEIINNKE